MDDMQEGLEAMQRDLEAILLTVAQDWRKFNKELEAFRRQSEKNPSSSADEAMGRVANLLGALRFHGLLIFDIDYEKKEIWEEHFVLSMSRKLWVWFLCFEGVQREVATQRPFL